MLDDVEVAGAAFDELEAVCLEAVEVVDSDVAEVEVDALDTVDDLEAVDLHVFNGLDELDTAGLDAALDLDLVTALDLEDIS